MYIQVAIVMEFEAILKISDGVRIISNGTQNRSYGIWIDSDGI